MSEQIVATEEQRRRVASLAARHGFRMVLLFGSAVTGREHARSDLDIAVLFEGDDPGFKEFSEACHDLQEVFPDRRVDVAAINHADPLFLKKILDRCVLLFGTESNLQEMKIFAFKRYQDHGRFFDMERTYAERFARKAAART
ncbi:MAG: nucleotidyltransferase domain-containing protein [Nitrospirota bacterium]